MHRWNQSTREYITQLNFFLNVSSFKRLHNLTFYCHMAQLIKFRKSVTLKPQLFYFIPKSLKYSQPNNVFSVLLETRTILLEARYYLSKDSKPVYSIVK